MGPSLCRDEVRLGGRVPLSSGLQGACHTQVLEAWGTVKHPKMLPQGSQGADATAWSLSGENGGNHGWGDGSAALACERAQEPQGELP